MITVTAVRVFPFDTTEAGGRVRAYAEVEIDGCLTLKGIRVIQTHHGGYFIGYPSQRARRDTFVDVIVPAKEAAAAIREAIMAEFRRTVLGEGEQSPAPPG